jgi:hypothetical protein
MMLFLLFFTHCSQNKVLLERNYRIVHPEIFNQTADSTKTLGITYLQNSSFNLTAPCDSCEVISASTFEFEFNTRIDSLLKAEFPQLKPLHLIPGVDVPARDSLLDTLYFRLRQHKNFRLSDYLHRDPIEILHREHISNEVRQIIKVIGGRYQANFLYTPIDAELIAYPEGKREGAYEIRQLSVIWNTQIPEVLYLLYTHYKIKLDGKNTLDKNWTVPLLNYLKKDLHFLKKDMPQLKLREPH